MRAHLLRLLLVCGLISLLHVAPVGSSSAVRIGDVPTAAGESPPIGAAPPNSVIDVGGWGHNGFYMPFQPGFSVGQSFTTPPTTTASAGIGIQLYFGNCVRAGSIWRVSLHPGSYTTHVPGNWTTPCAAASFPDPGGPTIIWVDAPWDGNVIVGMQPSTEYFLKLDQIAGENNCGPLINNGENPYPGGNAVQFSSGDMFAVPTIDLVFRHYKSLLPATTPICLSPGCGNGQVEDGEQCDGGPCCFECSFLASTAMCRGSAGSCDAAEYCTGSSSTCPSDSLLDSTTQCRGAGECNPAEFCTGLSADCPADLWAPEGTVCREPADDCDPDEFCTGNPGAGCPADNRGPGQARFSMFTAAEKAKWLGHVRRS